MTHDARRVDLAGVVVELVASSARQAQYLDWHFGALLSSQNEAELTVLLDGGTLDLPTTAPTVLDGPITRWDDGTVLWLEHELGGAARLRGRQFRISVADGPESWRVTRQLLYSGLSWFMEGRGRVVLHAAMVGRGRSALLLLGATSSGKSTAAISALVSGWDLLSDDLVVLRAAEGPPGAFGIPKLAAVEREAAALFDPRLQTATPDERGRVLLPKEVFATGWREIRALVVSDHDQGPGRVLPLSHADALGAIVASFLEASRGQALRRNLRSLSRVAALPTYRLAHAADPEHRLARSAELLDEVWRAC